MFASVHLAFGTNINWLQNMGGWASAKLLLNLYGHFLPTESTGFGDVIGGSKRQYTAVAESPDAPNENAPGLNDRGHYKNLERETGIASAVRPGCTAR